jgi:hypothetical protein
MIMRDIDKARLKGPVQTVTTEYTFGGSVFSTSLTFDTDGRQLTAQNFLDGVLREVPPDVLAASASWGVRSTHNADGTRTDVEGVAGLDGWSMEGLNVAIGTWGAVEARTTLDSRSVPLETLFLDSQNEETSRIRYTCDERGRILQAIQTSGPGVGFNMPAEVAEEFRKQLGADAEISRLWFEYDDAGRVTDSRGALMGNEIFHTASTYNSQGDTETITDQQGTTRYEYEYDAHGNWLRKVGHGPHGEQVESRVITYY